ncbi:MAG: hypothetical protein IPP88_15555 [Betaproteobacteria bacterium]|nr:hypothetical protein [Betaproteobacteria bacterium]
MRRDDAPVTKRELTGAGDASPMGVRGHGRGAVTASSVQNERPDLHHDFFDLVRSIVVAMNPDSACIHVAESRFKKSVNRLNIH